MAIVVKKFGGTSVGDVERIKRVAEIIANSSEKTIVVVSAMAGMTNQLVQQAQALNVLSGAAAIAEYDTVISSGEQITIGLLSLALMSLGMKARSYLGWQLPIETTNDFSQAKILRIATEKILADLDSDTVPVIAGFQGIYDNRITTLGRGGSDTTAVAVAAAVGARRCDIYTDVDGIYTADPRIVPKARKIDEISYWAAIALAGSGAKVIHPRAVEIAMNNQLAVRVLNTFSDDLGTEINSSMEKTIINGIAAKKDCVMITIKKAKDINQLLQRVLDSGVIIESVFRLELSIEKSGSEPCYTIVTGAEYLERCLEAIDNGAQIKEKMAMVSVVGISVKQALGKIIETLKENQVSFIDLRVIETQVSFLIDQIYMDKIVRSLHTNLQLDMKTVDI